MYLKVVHENSNSILGERILYADSFFRKLSGLMFRREFKSFDGMLFETSSIHTCFMRMPIDVLFLDKENNVSRIFEPLKPWRFTNLIDTKTNKVVELPPGKLSGKVKVGDKIRIENV